MARPASGQIYTRCSRNDVVYVLRFRGEGYPSRPIELGRLSQGFDMTQAARQRDLIVALIRAGNWTAPGTPTPPPREIELSFGAACARYVRKKRRKAPSTVADIVTKIEVHLLPGIGPWRPVMQIDDKLISSYIDGVLDQNARIRDAEARGEPLRRPPTARELQHAGGEPRRTPRLRPISDGQINKHIELIGQILDLCVEDDEIEANPVHIEKHRIPYEVKKDWMIQPDEIVSLLAASASLDLPLDKPRTRRLRGACVRLRRDGLTYRQIACQLGVSEGTVGYHLAPPCRPVVPMYETLIYLLMLGGLRISEALALRCKDVDLLHRNIHVCRSKTGAGVREVHIHPPLAEVLIEYKNARGNTWQDDAYLFSTRNGTPLSRHNVARRTMPRLLAAANALRDQQGHRPIGSRITAHAMRHAFVALLAHSGSPRIYTQTQAGHKRPTTADWIYSYVFGEDSREQIGARLVEVLDRGRRKIDNSRPPVPDPQHRPPSSLPA